MLSKPDGDQSQEEKADRTRHTTVRRQRGADQAAAGPIGTRPDQTSAAVSQSLGPRRSATAEPLRCPKQHLVAANQNRQICSTHYSRPPPRTRGFGDLAVADGPGVRCVSHFA
jgi:hypothetical protein